MLGATTKAASTIIIVSSVFFISNVTEAYLRKTRLRGTKLCQLPLLFNKEDGKSDGL